MKNNTKMKVAKKYESMLEEISAEQYGHKVHEVQTWAYSKDGFKFGSSDCHTENGMTQKELYKAIQTLQPCDCEECKQALEEESEETKSLDEMGFAMTKKQKVVKRFEIAKRADELGIMDFDRLTVKMDLENFDVFFDGKYSIDYIGLLESSDEVFTQDMYNLQMIIDRENMSVKNQSEELAELIRYKLKDDKETHDIIKVLSHFTDYLVTVDTDERVWKNDVDNSKRDFWGYSDEII